MRARTSGILHTAMPPSIGRIGGEFAFARVALDEALAVVRGNPEKRELARGDMAFDSPEAALGAEVSPRRSRLDISIGRHEAFREVGAVGTDDEVGLPS